MILILKCVNSKIIAALYNQSIRVIISLLTLKVAYTEPLPSTTVQTCLLYLCHQKPHSFDPVWIVSAWTIACNKMYLFNMKDYFNSKNCFKFLYHFLICCLLGFWEKLFWRSNHCRHDSIMKGCFLFSCFF